ncbi:Tricarboxylate transport protein TctC [Pseudonocardia sp. Ae406_Ps2]|uniref:Bug family tripartite tricarboxylate transporter substrate binding protein n=1 Tax=unclassified Pseudonocardia TaxID=2619320 RepID=UPI00094B55C0|nr:MULTISPECIES: tripartite tricarboxylate transporter substrate-binding protein [unclassified Pseudonocardia]OLL96364.1 Tricarboxylate transport protein TctC [Pseudonocardia sp. Ae331_Ps2]OLM05926.1 Tricarboxylate transport protein TctC [Pseudonocardia sp. Ae406_Ps2]OLM13518.1 Tricarboxylate transport protein TctC [Pseudonocardia sp. Ae505_Ps2]OLM27504.1 Tricarboxylate transport protein TctC [Pseudonocardia sp. Ae706_Ps2]OLM30659.1 Tricarboxylate transport protein TctC [Pseudonocardia sp. Ae7
MSKKTVLAALGVVVTLTLTGFAAVDASGSVAGQGPRTNLTLTAPAAPGGGWDLASRESQQALRAESIVNNVQVVNVPGAGGTIGLTRFVGIRPEPTQLMMTGTVMEGAITVNSSDTTLADTTPIARLAEDYEVLIVPAESPFRTLEEFLTAWRVDPHGQAVGGGGLGGTDHLLAGLVAQGAGIDPAEVNYISYAGGGEVLTALLSGTVAIGISGYNEFSDQIDAGNLRALAVSAERPVPGIAVPTLVDQGVDVALPNWRGLVAPPGITAQQRDELIAVVGEMVRSPSWQDTLARNNWEDAFLAGDEFGAFLAEDQARVNRIIEELGL